MSTGSIAYSLIFRPDAKASSRPQLTIVIVGPWSTDLKLQKAQADAPSAPTIDVGGHPAWLVQSIPGTPRSLSLHLLYDNHTVVAFDADGLTPQQLIAAAASLAPANPSVAPNVSADLPLCKHLGLCF
ncbi:MAG: hypothetical protein M3083_03555 [Actinomycetota bacterium]|nr:hypothetical protein [Actinomycetota bacterium]